MKLKSLIAPLLAVALIAGCKGSQNFFKRPPAPNVSSGSYKKPQHLIDSTSATQGAKDTSTTQGMGKK